MRNLGPVNMSVLNFPFAYDYVFPPSGEQSYNHVILVIVPGPGEGCGNPFGPAVFVTIYTSSSNSGIAPSDYMTGTFTRLCPGNVLTNFPLPGLSVSWGSESTSTSDFVVSLTVNGAPVPYKIIPYPALASPAAAPGCDQVRPLLKLSCTTCSQSTMQTQMPMQSTTNTGSTPGWFATHHTIIYIAIGLFTALIGLAIVIWVISRHDDPTIDE